MPLIQSKSKKDVSKNIETEMASGKPQKQSIAIALSVQRRNKKKKMMMAEGGMAEDVHASDLMPDEERASSIASAIMQKRKMASGGMVDSDIPESPSIFDEQNEMALEDDGLDNPAIFQPMTSNEHRPDVESDAHDMISKIRAKLRDKRGV